MSSLAEENSSRAEQITSLSSQLSKAQEQIFSLQSSLLAAQAAAIPLPASPLASTSAISPSQENPDALSTAEAAHALEVSNLTAVIRSLEDGLYKREMRLHELERQIMNLSGRSGTYRSTSGSGSGNGAKGYFFSPPDQEPSAPQSPTVAPKPRLNPVDAILPPSVRHKRQVSLNALKARMEPSVSLKGASPLRGSRTIAEVKEEASIGDEGRRESVDGRSVGVRKQFGDEIMFCCPACDGDLITL